MKLYNLTHAAQIGKHFPASDLPILMKQVQKTQDAFEQKLKTDQTKTKTEKARLAAKSATKQIEYLIAKTQAHIKPVVEKLEGFEVRTDEMKKIRNTTDSVVLNGTATALLAGNFNYIELHQMARDDADVARAVMVVPALKFRLKFNDNKKATFNKLIDRFTLGDDYAEYETAVQQDKLFNDLGQSLIGTFAEQVALLKEIESGIAVLPEPGDEHAA